MLRGWRIKSVLKVNSKKLKIEVYLFLVMGILEIWLYGINQKLPEPSIIL